MGGNGSYGFNHNLRPRLGNEDYRKKWRLKEFLKNPKENSDMRIHRLIEDVRLLDEIVNKMKITHGDTTPVPPLTGNNIHLDLETDFHPDSMSCCGDPVLLEDNTTHFCNRKPAEKQQTANQ